MSSTSDALFRRKRRQVKDFDFGEDTAEVFDNMLDRSVPFYTEIQRMIGEMAADFAVSGTNLYDLGCSTCSTFIQIDSVIAKGVNFIGTDASEAMLAKAKESPRNLRQFQTADRMVEMSKRRILRRWRRPKLQPPEVLAYLFA